MDRKKNIFDKIGALLPGYKGYSKREGRRSSHKILRENICLKINIIEDNFSDEMLNSGNDSKTIMNLEKARKEINNLSSKIKFLEYGATSFFNDSQIDENELTKIYQIDLEISDFINDFLKDKTKISIKNADILIKKCNEFLLKRKIFLSNFK